MSKLYRTPIEVNLSPDGLPAAFQWRRRWYYVTSCAVIQDKPAWTQKYGNYDKILERVRLNSTIR